MDLLCKASYHYSPRLCSENESSLSENCIFSLDSDDVVKSTNIDGRLAGMHLSVTELFDSSFVRSNNRFDVENGDRAAERFDQTSQEERLEASPGQSIVVRYARSYLSRSNVDRKGLILLTNSPSICSRGKEVRAESHFTGRSSRRRDRRLEGREDKEDQFIYSPRLPSLRCRIFPGPYEPMRDRQDWGNGWEGSGGTT